MLPDIRAVIAAVLTAVGLLTLAFGVAATFRVAQDSRAGSLHADIAQRGRYPLQPSNTPHTALIVETPAASPQQPAAQEPEGPGPALALAAPAPAETPATANAELPLAPAETAMPKEPDVTLAVVPRDLAPEPIATPVQTSAALPEPEPSVGGPFVEPVSAAQAQSAEHVAAARKAAKLAAEKRVRAARAARLARERRAAAARRAALARRAQATATASFGWNARQTNNFDAFNAGAAATKTR